jgi:hypothetical protein
MQITEREERLLNFYRASELHGGLILGGLVRRAAEPELILKLTRHSAEEVRHSELWAQTILAVGGEPRPIDDTYQSRYAAVLARSLDVPEVLALTQVFERRVYRHFLEHARRSGTHARVRTCLGTMIEEERDHLSWVWEWLNHHAGMSAPELQEMMRGFHELDDGVYQQLCEEYEWHLAA